MVRYLTMNGSIVRPEVSKDERGEGVNVKCQVSNVKRMPKSKFQNLTMLYAEFCSDTSGSFFGHLSFGFDLGFGF
jgi:hypothetical protein